MKMENYSIEEALRVCRELFKILEETTKFTGLRVGGGFLRDCDNGVVPKDIDIYVVEPRTLQEVTIRNRVRVVPRAVDEDTIEVNVIRFFNAIGHKKVRLGDKEVNNDYPNSFKVWESCEFPEGHLPVNLIVCNQEHPCVFDIGLCSISFWNGDHGLLYGPDYTRDKGNKWLTLINIADPLLGHTIHENIISDGAVDRLVNHIRRVMEKYPDHKVKLSDNLISWVNLVGSNTSHSVLKVIERLQEENIIERPGEILPAQAEVIDWDALRLQHREARARDDAVVGVQAEAANLRGEAQVLPRLQGLFRDWLIDEDFAGRGQGVLPRGV
ncbi:hypothetical protein Epa1_p27 [Pseudomonas phage Epa1]|uniref:Nucleotidyltransferase n=1 Tax=Pseudomonas phage Epa1 TaxID=2719568 RepID=A0A6G9LFJ3_9CAUD|nr:hypothetical protein Epa1_p27 [Pseudomonas phage Epa1]